jgi:nitrogen fixation/metabolism regulation signal transduction histidine kinase
VIKKLKDRFRQNKSQSVHKLFKKLQIPITSLQAIVIAIFEAVVVQKTTSTWFDADKQEIARVQK